MEELYLNLEGVKNMRRLQIQDFVVLAGANVGLAVVSAVAYTLTTYATHAVIKWTKAKKVKEEGSVQPA